MDDIFYDALRKRIYVSGGEGFISVFQQKGPDAYEPDRQGRDHDRHAHGRVGT